MIVTIKAVDSATWGVADSKTGGIATHYDGCDQKYQPGLDKITGRLRTGLTKEEEKEFETMIGYEAGTLAVPSDPNKVSFWDSFFMIIPKEGLKLDTDNPHDNFRYKVISADPLVAKGMADMKKIAHPDYIIISEEAESTSKNKKRETIAKAYAKYDTLTADEVYDALVMLGKDASTLSPTVARDRLGDEVESNPSGFLAVMTDPLIKEKLFFNKLIRLGIVTKGAGARGTDVPLYFTETYLGKGLEEAIQFVKEPENQQLWIGMKKAHDEATKHLKNK
jgi:hypothetical protein